MDEHTDTHDPRRESPLSTPPLLDTVDDHSSDPRCLASGSSSSCGISEDRAPDHPASTPDVDEWQPEPSVLLISFEKRRRDGPRPRTSRSGRKEVLERERLRAQLEALDVPLPDIGWIPYVEVSVQ